MKEKNGPEPINKILPEIPPFREPDLSAEELKKISEMRLKEMGIQREFPANLQVNRQMIPKSRINAINVAVKAGKWPLYFSGASGRGKSFAAAMVYAEWPRKIWKFEKYEIIQDEPCFFSASTVISDLVEARMRGGTHKIQNTFERSTLIVLDDIVDRGLSDARRAALLDLFEWRKGKPLILTGNFPVVSSDNQPTLADVVQDERIISRMLEGAVLEFGGKDLRMQSLKITRV